MNFFSYRFYLPLIFLIGISCQKSKVIEIKNDQGVIIERITTELRDTGKLKDGFYEKFDDQGKPLESAHYKEGKLNGERKLYEKGFIYSLENYTLTGIMKIYYPDGKIKEVVTMVENEENGPFQEYYQNGKIKANGFYKNGPYEEGLLNLFDSTGTLIKKMNCKEGICTTTWTLEMDSTKTK